MEKFDFVVRYPKAVNDYYQSYGYFPDNLVFEEGYACNWENKFYIHVRATLPLTDYENGLGFGLWVEVSCDDFEKYLATDENDELFLSFKVEGVLACNWPGFEEAIGSKVKIEAVSINENLYVTKIVETDNYELKELLMENEENGEKMASLYEDLKKKLGG